MSKMLDELRPMTVGDAARSLGIDVFEVVRLLVASRTADENLSVNAEVVSELRTFGGIQDSWWEGAAEPSDANPERGRLRAALQLLRDRGHLGTNTTRMDNVWRGLSAADQDFLQTALSILGEEGHLALVASPVGIQVSIHDDSKNIIDAIIDKGTMTSGLNAIFEE